MSGTIPQAQLQHLKTFVDQCKRDPSILHLPELAFFKSWVEGMDASVPAEPKHTPPPKSPHKATQPEPESDESDIELDNAGVVDDPDDFMPEYPEVEIDVTEEMMDESDDKRQKAVAVLNEGNLEEAVYMFTEAIKLNPTMAPLYAKRASVYICMKKLKAAIHDCDRAIGLNPDTASPYKFRGKAKMMLGCWEDSYHDLTLALKLDYDDDTNEMLKQVKPNALKIQAHKRKYELKRKGRTEKTTNEKVKKATEAHRKATKDSKISEEQDFFGESPGGNSKFFGEAPLGGAIPDFDVLLKDPEFVSAFQDPEVSAALMDVSENPTNIPKYQDNPKLQKVIEMVTNKFGKNAGSKTQDGGGKCDGAHQGNDSGGAANGDLGVD